MQGLVGDGTSGLVGAETAGVTTVEVTNVGMMTCHMADGEFLNGYIRCPYDLDVKHPIGFRVAYTLDHDGAGTATVAWILLQDAIAEGSAIALPSTALNTTIANDSYVDGNRVASVTDFLLQWSGRGIRNSLGLSKEQVEDGAFITMKLEMDAATNETTVRFIGMEMDYTIHNTIGAGPTVNTPLKSKTV